MMKTLEEYNNEKRALIERARLAKAGVACNSCGEELVYSDPNFQYMSNPPMMAVYCANENCNQHNKMNYKIV